MDTLQKILVSRSLLSSFINFIPCPIAFAEWQGEDLVILYLNQRFLNDIGYTLEEIPTTRDWWKRAYPDDDYRRQIKHTWMEQADQATEKGQDEITLSAQIQTKHRGARWYEVKATIWDRYQAIALVDIDNLELRNRQLTAINTAKDNLLSVLTHDVRGPLKRLHSMMDMFQKEYITREELLTQLTNIQEEVGYTLQTIDQTMDWVSASKEGGESRVAEVAMDTLMRQVVDSHQYLATRKEINLSGEFSADTLTIDPEVIRIMLRNLLNNAIKYTPRGGWVRVTNRVVAEGMEIKVQDSGQGLTDEQISIVLNKRGYSLPGTENEMGTGIGLSIVRNLAREHNVWLSVDSVPHQGSTFTLLFPSE